MKCRISFLYIGIILIMFFSSSCRNRKEVEFIDIVSKWLGKEILFPKTLNGIVNEKFVENYSTDHKGYVIVSYIDSIGCTSCKLNFRRWKEIMMEINSFGEEKVSVLFFLNAKSSDNIYYKVKWDGYSGIVFLDDKDTFNRMNNLPTDSKYQTFLLNSDNKIMSIGNPTDNSKVKELYLKMIMGDKALKETVRVQTTVAYNATTLDMGAFDWQQDRTGSFELTNTGNHPLVIIDAVTSCGCTSVVYDKAPIPPGKSTELKVCYKADHPEHFNKTITVHCNAEASPVKFSIKGNAR